MRFPESDDDVVLIHNPKCSKSRALKALLEERGMAHRELRYLEEPLTADELAELGARLEQGPEAWVRPGEPAYQEADLGPNPTGEELIAAMVAHPSILQRPILIRGRRARVGRPIEGVLDLLD